MHDRGVPGYVLDFPKCLSRVASGNSSSVILSVACLGLECSVLQAVAAIHCNA
jgi:hypothetical protein